MASSRNAAGAKFFICEEGHLHVTLHDRAGKEFANAVVDEEVTVDVVFKLVDELDRLYQDEDDDPGSQDPSDTIGPTMGSA